jgi:predicted membrane channel-forming protein YqfA (hemolysin III family)
MGKISTVWQIALVALVVYVLTIATMSPEFQERVCNFIFVMFGWRGVVLFLGTFAGYNVLRLIFKSVEKVVDAWKPGTSSSVP